jgi:hypothetical protein
VDGTQAIKVASESDFRRYLIVPKSNSPFEEVDMVPGPGRTLITFKAAPNPDTGELFIRCLIPYPVGLFYFNGIRGQPEARYSAPKLTGNLVSDLVERWRHILELILYTVVTPAQSNVQNMWFGEADASDGHLWVRSEKSETISILGKTPGGKYNIAIAHHDLQFQSQRPFWFQHDQKSFFIEPRDGYLIPIIFLPSPLSINPGLLDGVLVRRYYDVPIFRGPPVIYPRPDAAGPMRFSPTFEYKSDLNATLKPRSIQAASPTLTDRGLPAGKALAAAALPSLKDIVTDFKPIRSIDISRYRIPAVRADIHTKFYKFSTFYHPFVSEMIRTLNRDGIDGLYQRPLQQAKSDTFKQDYDPSSLYVETNDIPIEMVDFDDNVFAVYNWELFFHVPVMIAERLSKNHQGGAAMVPLCIRSDRCVAGAERAQALLEDQEAF